MAVGAAHHYLLVHDVLWMSMGLSVATHELVRTSMISMRLLLLGGLLLLLLLLWLLLLLLLLLWLLLLLLLLLLWLLRRIGISKWPLA